jgi:hypothetical protein
VFLGCINTWSCLLKCTGLAGLREGLLILSEERVEVALGAINASASLRYKLRVFLGELRVCKFQEDLVRDQLLKVTGVSVHRQIGREFPDRTTFRGERISYDTLLQSLLSAFCNFFHAESSPRLPSNVNPQPDPSRGSLLACNINPNLCVVGQKIPVLTFLNFPQKSAGG